MRWSASFSLALRWQFVVTHRCAYFLVPPLVQLIRGDDDRAARIVQNPLSPHHDAEAFVLPPQNWHVKI